MNSDFPVLAMVFVILVMPPDTTSNAGNGPKTAAKRPHVRAHVVVKWNQSIDGWKPRVGLCLTGSSDMPSGPFSGLVRWVAAFPG